MVKRRSAAARAISIFVLFLLIGCAAVHSPDSHVSRFFEKLNRYPQSRERLAIPKLTGNSFIAIPDLPASPDVIIMVHPGYSLFFRDANRSKHAGAKYALLAKQFENEARFMAEAARAGKILVLIIPGKYEAESHAPLSYTSYLNGTAADGRAVFYLFSESASSGAVSMNDMVDLYRFLQGIKAGKVLIGGGYIGRCQREFYNELTAHFDKASSYIVPEISAISPDDITEAEAGTILESMRRQDYRPVRKFIDKKLDSGANLLSIPQKREL